MTQQLICCDHGKHGCLCDRVSGAAFYKAARLVFVLLTTLMLFSCGNDNSDPEVQASIEQARAYVRQNNTWNAIIEYRNAVRLDPENDTAYFELAENYVLLNTIGKAIKAYQTAATINPENNYAKLRLGQIYLTIGKLMEARKIISDILETNPQIIEAYHLLSSIQIKGKKNDAAIGTLKKAMLISKTNIKTRLTLASLYKVSSNPDLAEGMYKEAFDINTSLGLPYMELFEIYRKDKAWDKMETLLLQILKTNEIKETKIMNLARFYEGQKKFHVAQTYYDRAVDEFPQSIQALMTLAAFHTRRNNRDKAIGTMEKAVNLSPDNIVCQVGLAQIYLAFDMPEYAWYVINKAVELDNYNLDANFIIGKLLMLRGDFKGAYDYISWVIGQGFTSADTYHLRALCTKYKPLLDNSEADRQEKMKKDLQKALVVDPGNLESRMALIEIYLYEKNTLKVEEHIDFVFRKSAGKPRELIMMAALKILQGHPIEKDGGTNPRQKGEAGNRDIVFGGRGIHEFVFKFYSTGSFNKVSSDLINPAENKNSYAHDMEFFSAEDKFKPGPEHNSFEKPVDMAFLAASLSRMDEPTGTVNLFWILSYFNGNPSASLRPLNSME